MVYSGGVATLPQNFSLTGPEGEAGPASIRITHERGPVTRQIRAAVLATGGEAAWESLLDSVSPACRDRFTEPIGYYEWVESSLALELHEAWSRQQGGDNMLKRGEDAAREIFGGVQRWILRLASPLFLLENVPRVFRFYYRGGEMKLVHLIPGQSVLELRASGYPDAWFEIGLSAAMKVSLELAGVREVAVSHFPPRPGETEPDLHRYEVSWLP